LVYAEIRTKYIPLVNFLFDRMNAY
jgi:hypothetical protein